MMRKTLLVTILATGCATGALCSTAAHAQTEQRSYDIAAQPLADALREYSEASGREVMFDDGLARGLRSAGVSGTLSADAALSRLLTGTGLIAELIGATLVIRAGNVDAGTTGSIEAPGDIARDTPDGAIIVTGSRIRGAGPVGSPVTTLDRTAIERSGMSSAQQLLQALPQAFGGGPNETTLGATTRNGAGTDGTYASSVNLRGLGPSSTLVLVDGSRPALGGLGGVFADISLIPVSAIDRIEVLTDGASAIYGADAVAGVVNIRLRNDFEGAETMLRAGTADGDLGEMQFGQLFGKHWSRGHVVLAYQFSQRGALAAAERAYATEDLRPFGGPDYRSLFAVPGTITAANGQTFAIPAGQDGTALGADQLTPGTRNPGDRRAASDLLPRQRIHSLYAAGSFDISDSLTFRASLLAAQRSYRKIGLGEYLSPVRVASSNPYYVDPIGTGSPVTVRYNFANDLGAPTDAGRVRGFTAAGGFEKQLGRWRVQLGGAYGRQKGRSDSLNIPNRPRLAAAIANTDPATAFNVFGDGSANNPATIAEVRGSIGSRDDYRSWSAALRADGPLVGLPGGDVRLAIGAEYRRERYWNATANDISFATPRITPLTGLPGPRHVRSAYAELLVPIVGAANAMPGIQRLDLSLAGRIEDYSDVGTTTNPKVGVRWEPISGIALRASYGTSFRAPAFDELIGPSVSLYTTLVVPDPASPTGTANVVALFGYGPWIKPERATTWTAGFDIALPAIPGLKASITYYDIDYRDRIGSASEDYARFLTDRDQFGGVVIDNPSTALLDYYFAFPTFTNPLGLAPGDIDAILDGQVRNLSAVRQTGLDIDIGYAPHVAGGTLDLGLAGSRILKIDRQLTPGTAPSDIVGTFANPVKWRLRGRTGWSKDGFAATAFINYTGGYRNQIPAVAERVASWTTVDLTFSQRIGEAEDARGLTLGLSLLNLFDKDPPYVNNRTNTSALGYDPEKANPLGRMVSVQATVRW
ncbi:TonB-dependent receptor [Sphingopyxis witflariensis]|uniref:TonB-dependent receptor n=1 Tax=Sphingopyxis witflariensis TaxID=173675 RepID=A0A2D0AMN2_9SPHN|nr:TonB-dependent receptor [Sphingopyxis witflariensis]OWQ94307.1 TonB-dependent receptor [Sphingopyxis witflariensis]